MSNVSRAIQVFILGVTLATAPASADFALKDTDRVVFFGDTSLVQTYFTEWFGQFLRARYPERKTEIFCLGAPKSSAADGNRRFGKEVAPLKPTWIVLSFGLDSPMRKAFSQAQLDKYAAEMGKMISAANATGAQVVVLTPPPPDLSRNRALERHKYDMQIGKYAEALRKVAGEKGVDVVDWYKAASDYVAKYKGKAKLHWTQRGLIPTGVSVAVLTDELLAHWRAEPLDYVISANWASENNASVTMGTVNVSKHTETLLVLELTGVPTPISKGSHAKILPDPWPMAKWCRYQLKIAQMPPGGAVVSQAGAGEKPQGAKPFLTQQLLAGADLSSIGPFASHRVTTELHNAIRTKTNQVAEYCRFCNQKPPYAELKEGYRLWLDAHRELMFGTHRITLRLPSRFDVTLKIELASAAAKRQPPGRPTQPRTRRK